MHYKYRLVTQKCNKANILGFIQASSPSVGVFLSDAVPVS